MDKPNISVIIPTYNRPRQLTQCLEALSATRGETFEVIVVDDGSPEPIETTVYAFADRLDISCLRRKNAGPASARNVGARVARAPILAFTDDDCRPEPDWLSRIAEAVRRNPHALAGGRTYNSLEHNIFSETSQDLVSFFYEYAAERGGGLHFFASNNLACSARYHTAIGGFDERFPLAAGEDRDYSLRWMDMGWPLVYVPDAVIGHAHRFDNFGQFWRLHLRYGRGASHLRARAATRESKKIPFESIRFYALMVSYPFRKRRPRPFLRMALLGLSQVAVVAGFIAERLRDVHQGRSLEQ
ncbi:glycosyltransferase family 2 protein [Candidatus Thiosymbion oneisti]|uniref:glycosyltransferase family 2 protein n=1 Tax=Candidatus Thiosymbion oneisti TaxID=589554 RepID=UPI00105D6317|nr:glycosyltransferase [Candidatus Thiosymbion oneisti]